MAKVKAKAKAKASGRTGGAGRPKEDPTPKLNIYLREVSSATNQTEKIFGSGWKSHKVNVDRWVADLETVINELDDETEGQKLILIKKQAEASRALCNSYASKGPSSQEFLEAYNEQIHFLEMEPKASSPFPFFLRDNILTLQGQHAWPPIRFWPVLNYHRLTVEMPDVDIGTRQIQLVKDRCSKHTTTSRSVPSDIAPNSWTP